MTLHAFVSCSRLDRTTSNKCKTLHNEIDMQQTWWAGSKEKFI